MESSDESSKPLNGTDKTDKHEVANNELPTEMNNLQAKYEKGVGPLYKRLNLLALQGKDLSQLHNCKKTEAVFVMLGDVAAQYKSKGSKSLGSIPEVEETDSDKEETDENKDIKNRTDGLSYVTNAVVMTLENLNELKGLDDSYLSGSDLETEASDSGPDNNSMNFDVTVSKNPGALFNQQGEAQISRSHIKEFTGGEGKKEYNPANGNRSGGCCQTF